MDSNRLQRRKSQQQAGGLASEAWLEISPRCPVFDKRRTKSRRNGKRGGQGRQVLCQKLSVNFSLSPSFAGQFTGDQCGQSVAIGHHRTFTAQTSFHAQPLAPLFDHEPASLAHEEVPVSRGSSAADRPSKPGPRCPIQPKVLTGVCRCRGGPGVPGLYLWRGRVRCDVRMTSFGRGNGAQALPQLPIRRYRDWSWEWDILEAASRVRLCIIIIPYPADKVATVRWLTIVVFVLLQS